MPVSARGATAGAQIKRYAFAVAGGIQLPDTINVRIVRAAERLSEPAPETAIAASTIPWRHAERGPVRLVIDMPAQTRGLVAATAAFSGGMFGIVLAFAGLLRVLIGGPFIQQTDAALIFWVLMAAGALTAIVAVFGGAGSAREVLEIDSRFVSVTRVGRIVGLWDRHQAGVFRPWTEPNRVFSRWLSRHFLDRPTIAWGDERCPGVAGAGVSSEVMARLLPEISAFCADNPPEPGFEYVPGTIPMEHAYSLGGTNSGRTSTPPALVTGLSAAIRTAVSRLGASST